MLSKQRRLAGVCVGAAVVVSMVAACSSSGNKNNNSPGNTGTNQPPVSSGSAPQSGGSSSSSAPDYTPPNYNGKKGGTLYYTTGIRFVEHWDSTRVYIGRDIANESRLFTRTLVQYGAGPTAASNQLHPDLATDLGRPSDDNKTWQFTLKTGVKWEDGSPVTCQDVAYGVSRSFAVDVLTGGPNYSLQFLDIPNDPKGGSAYKGPYTKVGQKYYDKAVTCSGQTITFHLKKSVPDFNFTTTLPAFAPYKQAQDHGAKSNFQVFSDGPYRLQGTWTQGKGGTFVRNPMYDPKTDDSQIRRALPDKIVFFEGPQPEVIFDRLLKDSGNDQFLVTDRTAPPDYFSRIQAQKSRYTDSPSPFDDYIVPNFKNLGDNDPHGKVIREALAISTNRTGYILAEGGPIAANPAYSLILPALGAAGGYKKFKAYNVPDSGDPKLAKSMMQKAGVKLPYHITFTYSGGSTVTDDQASALKDTWDKAGFDVTLNSLKNTYYDIVQNPQNASKYDATFGGWGADWPNASTVIPPLFDSRVNLSKQSNGQDYGLYDSKVTNSAIDKAYNTADAASRNAQWGNLDEALAKEVAYIPLDNPKFPRLHGSKVTNYTESASTNGYPDLGQLGAES